MSDEGAKDLVREMGFIVHSTTRNGGILLTINALREDGIGIRVWPSSDEFELYYIVPGPPLFTVRTEKMGGLLMRDRMTRLVGELEVIKWRVLGW